MKRASDFCKLFMWANIGAFFGKALSTFSFYRSHPAIYAMMPTPWYAELFAPLCYTILVTIFLITIRAILEQFVNLE